MLPYCAHTLTSLALCSCAQLVIQIICSTAAAGRYKVDTLKHVTTEESYVLHCLHEFIVPVSHTAGSECRSQSCISHHLQ